MLNITKQQALKRWDTLQMNLREALFSEYNADILWRICEEQHLSEDKISKIATLAGDVIMGFMHPEDLDDEIKKELGINSEIAASVARQIDRKIFSLIKNDINKVYAPSGSLAEEKLAEESALPTEISEEHIVDLRARAEAEKPQMISLDALKTEIGTETEIEKPKEEKPAIMAIKEEIKTEDQPFILHKYEEIKPILGAKKSLGGLFGFLGKEEIKEEAKAPKPVAVEIQIGGIEPLKPPAPLIKEIKLPEPPKPTEKVKKVKIEERAGFFRRITDFFKSLFIKKEIYYKEIEIPLIPPELARFQAIQQKKIETTPQPPKPPAPARIVHYTDLRTPLKIEPVVSGEFIKIEHPTQYQPKPIAEPPIKKEEITVDLRKAVEPKIEPKIEPKKQSGEMIDLSTMKKL